MQVGKGAPVWGGFVPTALPCLPSMRLRGKEHPSAQALVPNSILHTGPRGGGAER